MKILFIKSQIHHKNLHFILNCKNINLYIFESINNIDLNTFDAVYSPCEPIDVSKYPNTKFIFGPHFSVFPQKQHMDIIQGLNSIYIQPSEWANNVWKYHPICKNIRIETLPFGVDVNKFNETKHINQRNEVILYYKNRHLVELNTILNFLIGI